MHSSRLTPCYRVIFMKSRILNHEYLFTAEMSFWVRLPFAAPAHLSERCPKRWPICATTVTRHLALLLISDGGPLLANLARHLLGNIFLTYDPCSRRPSAKFHATPSDGPSWLLFSSLPPLLIHIVDVFNNKLTNALKIENTF